MPMPATNQTRQRTSTRAKVAVYDLRYCPVTFDFANFLAAARLYFASITGNTAFDLIIVASSFRKSSPRDLAFTDTEKTWRLYNLILPIIGCSPFIGSFAIVKDPGEIPDGAMLYPPVYDKAECHSPFYYFGAAIRKYYFNSLHPACFRAPMPALKHARSIFFTNKKKALISPRFSNYEASRNTKLEHVSTLAKGLQHVGFEVGVIPDQDAIGSSHQLANLVPGLIVLQAASFSIPLRLALIETVAVNLFTPSALMAFGQLAKSNPSFVCFDMHKPPNRSYTGDIADYKSRGGMTPLEVYPYPWSKHNNIFVWDKEFDPGCIIDHAVYASQFKLKEQSWVTTTTEK